MLLHTVNILLDNVQSLQCMVIKNEVTTNVLQAAVNNCWKDKSLNAGQKTKQTVQVFSAQQVFNCFMRLDWRLRNFGYYWTSLFLGREECRWCHTAVAGCLEELKPVDKTHSNTKGPDHADTCKPAWQFSIQFVDGTQANVDRATLVWCDWISVC